MKDDNYNTLLKRIQITRERFLENWSLFIQNKIALIGLLIITGLFIISIFPSIFSPYDPQIRGPPETHYSPPSLKHPLGTDDEGKDLMSLIIYGTRTSLLIGLLAALTAVGLGTLVGLVSGFYRGLKGEFLMRITDIFLVLPTVPLMIVLAATLKPSIWNVALAIGLTGWTQTARIVRSQTLSVRERAFVYRAQTIGCTDGRILRRYILPEVLPLLGAQFILSIVLAITAEAFLSFLGLGDLSQISWGSILFFAFKFGAFTIGAYWYFLPPGICIIITILAFTAISQGLDEIFNPRLRKI